MANNRIRIIKKADRIETPDRPAPVMDTQTARDRITGWITERRLNAEAQRMRDLKAFFGTVTA